MALDRVQQIRVFFVPRARIRLEMGGHFAVFALQGHMRVSPLVHVYCVHRVRIRINWGRLQSHLVCGAPLVLFRLIQAQLPRLRANFVLLVNIKKLLHLHLVTCARRAITRLVLDSILLNPVCRALLEHFRQESEKQTASHALQEHTRIAMITLLLELRHVRSVNLEPSKQAWGRLLQARVSGAPMANTRQDTVQRLASFVQQARIKVTLDILAANVCLEHIKAV